ncbi:arginyl-tRNA synthetase [Dictyostelium discoideum AX4]|uniref:arginine--tRNA ligase n=1 Tax=Dictyostelium discoideum TaxID=44689 RepID=Q54JT6_DICDI|nr:arginyl-tRNA synthetase [Dictyostelium discoideum AX4]EAL63548.1 arginyl-tRNA synthetase [Dictyostelium discoideum AX4]|eukprot:XP_637066.1 arginyl-tRNA synthetase [Dictyostelium discoideum AX4]
MIRNLSICKNFSSSNNIISIKPIYLLNIKRNFSTTQQQQLKKEIKSNQIEDFNVKNKWFDINSRSAFLLLNQCFKSIFEKALTKEEIEKVFKNEKIKYQASLSTVPSKKVFDHDYSLSNLVVASMLLKDNNLGQKLIDAFESNKSEIPYSSMIEKLELSNKGHLNLRVSDEYLTTILKLWINPNEDKSKFLIDNLKFQDDVNLNEMEKENKLLPIRSKKVLVDFASPNMSKELHVGHLRSIALGESICRILEYMGHDVERISHAGDFGTPLGIVLAHSLETNADYLKHIQDPTCKDNEPIIPTPKELSELYTTSKKRTKSDEQFSKRTLWTAAEFQKGPPIYDKVSGEQIGGSDPIVYDAWLSLCEASRIGFNKVFQMLDINVNERGESFYRDMLPGVIEDLTKMGFVDISDDGRKCIFLDKTKCKDSQVPVVVQKSDGAYLYATTDIAAIKHRVENGKEWVIVITDDSQSDHFQQVFKIAEDANWLNRKQTRVDHLSFGVVRGPNGQKLSSRDGNPIALIDLLQESIERSKQATSLSKSFTRSEKLDITQNANNVEINRMLDTFENNNNDDNNNETTIDEKHFLKIGMGALKYYDLAHRNNPYVFSYDSILSFKGNTSIYILYCYTRISTLLRRANFDGLNLNPNLIEFKEFTEKERNLVFIMSRFSDVMKGTEQSLKPGFICDYLWDLANSFHQFYETEKIIGNERQDQRLFICLAVQRILSTGLHLLGVETVEKL